MAKPAEAQAKTETTEHKKPEAPSKAKGPTAVAGSCTSWGCKASSTQFNFCAEHFDQFKFGLIKKTGEQVPDYEKKFEHFQAFKAKEKARKIA